MTYFYPYEPSSWDLQSQRLVTITCLFSSGLSLIPLNVSNITFLPKGFVKGSAKFGKFTVGGVLLKTIYQRGFVFKLFTKGVCYGHGCRQFYWREACTAIADGERARCHHSQQWDMLSPCRHSYWRGMPTWTVLPLALARPIERKKIKQRRIRHSLLQDQ